MEPDAQAAPAIAPAAAPQNYSSPDDLNNDMSEEEEAAYVDRVLGITPKEATETPKVDPKPTEAEAPKDLAAPVDPAEPVVPSTTPEPEAPAEVAPVLKTDDLWIEVQSTDKDGNPATVKLTLDEGIPDDFQFTNDKQLYEVLDSFNEMKRLRGERQAAVDKWESDKQEREAESQNQQEVFNSWDAEIQDLIEDGLIEAPKLKGDDPNFRTDPSVKKVEQVFEFMRLQNEQRLKDNKAPIRSFTAAFNKWQSQENKVAEEQKAKDEAELVKKRGAIVGGTSAPTGADKGYVYKRGSAKNIWQVPIDDI